MRFIPIFVLAFLLVNCGKDSFTTTPQLKYLSVNSKLISGSQILTIKLRLTDKEGDYTSLLGYKKTVAGCSTSDKLDSAVFTIPAEFILTKQTEGEVVVTLNRIDRGSNSCLLPGGGIRPDTSIYSFWTRDKAGHTSDTARTEPIIILN